MLTTKLNVRLATGTVNGLRSDIIFGKWDILKHYGKSNFHVGKICVNNFPLRERFVKFSSKCFSPTIASDLFKASKAGSVSSPQTTCRNFTSENLNEVTADTFGDLGDKNYEKTEMDESELKEEEFIMNEAKKPRRSVPSSGKYIYMIKQHIASGDLKAAVGVLDQIKDDRTETNGYMFSLIIRALGMQGDLKKCFSLFNRMKKQGLSPTSPIYISLLNACANSSYSQLALKKLTYVRQLFIEEDIKLNHNHYNVMIKVYGRHGKLLEAFQMVDEMRDRKLNIGTSTFNFLLQGAIADKEAGFRHALIVWQILRSGNLKPDIFTYNLLLRSARDCKLGKFNIRDLLVSPARGETVTRIVYSDRINLLAYPPALSQSLSCISDSKKLEGNHSHVNDPERATEPTELVTEQTSDSMLEPAIESTDEVPNVYLESCNPETNLLLMGGFNNFIDQMKRDNVQPNIKTVTFLMEVVPHTSLAEKAVIKYAKAIGVQLDTNFYNLLIRKRSFRFNYAGALEVLDLMQRDHLEPNIMTWGVLALSCHKTAQVRELFEGMELTGQRKNVQIFGAIIRQGCIHWNFGIVLEMMETMRRMGVRPSPRIYDILESLWKKAAKLNKDKNSPDFIRAVSWQNGWRKFNLRYPAWLKEIKAKSEERRKEFI